MIGPLLLVLLSLLGLGAALALPGLSDLTLIAAPALIAALILLWRTARNPRTAQPAPPVIVDGSNVFYWQDGTPRIDPLLLVLRDLEARGYKPGVVFDANAGYLLEGRYRHHRAMSRVLGLPEDHVHVVAKAEPADRLVLTAARDLQARVVSNDRFRDWAEDFPEVLTPGFLIPGGFRDGVLWLDLGPAPHGSAP